MSPHSAIQRLSDSPVRVAICDDSRFMVQMLHTVLGAIEGIDVIGTATNAAEAIALCRTMRPDVLTLDLELPDMDGVTVLREIADLPTRVLVVSAHTSDASSTRAVEVLAEGAVDFLGKPGTAEHPSVFAAQLRELVRLIGTDAHHRRELPRLVPPEGDGATLVAPSESDRLLIIGASTGGPPAIDRTLRALPSPLPVPVIIVQHMPNGFTAPFSRRLRAATGHDVRHADDGMPIEPGQVVIARAGFHLHINGDRLYLGEGDRVHGVRPSIDVTLLDAVAEYGDRVTATILTGMGVDGREGVRAVRGAGGRVVAEHADSCVVYGMPRVVVESGLADVVVPLLDMPRTLIEEMAR